MNTDKKVTSDVNTDLCIGDFPAQDVCDFCNVEWKEGIKYDSESLGIVKHIISYTNGYLYFNRIAALFPVDWLVYRGMIWQGTITHAISIICYFLCLHFYNSQNLYFEKAAPFNPVFAFLTVLVPLCLIMPFLSVPLYHKHICKCLEARGLKKRKNTDCPELKESLRRQGAPSVKRVILFRIITSLLYACIEGIYITVRYGFFS